MDDKDRFKARFGSPTMHAKMVDHPDENIRGQVAYHGSEHIKRKLENDKADYVRAMSMHNAPKEMLDRGMHDKSGMVRGEVAASGDESHHRHLMHDADENVRFNVAHHAKDHEVLHHLAQDYDWHVKDNVIENPNTHLDTLAHMAKHDPRPQIRKRAEKQHYGRSELDGWIPESFSEFMAKQ